MDYTHKYIKYKTKYIERKRNMKGGFPNEAFHSGDKFDGKKLLFEPMPFINEQNNDVLCFNNNRNVEIADIENYDIAYCDVDSGKCKKYEEHNKVVPNITCLEHHDIEKYLKDNLEVNVNVDESLDMVPSDDIDLTKFNRLSEEKPIYVSNYEDAMSKFVIKINPILSFRGLLGAEDVRKIWSDNENIMAEGGMVDVENVCNKMEDKMARQEFQYYMTKFNTYLDDATPSMLFNFPVKPTNKEFLMIGSKAPKNHHLLRMYGFKFSTIPPEKTKLEKALDDIEDIRKYANLNSFIELKKKILDRLKAKSIIFYMEKLIGDVRSDGGIINNHEEFNHMILHIIAGVVTLAKHNFFHADLHSMNVMYSYKMKNQRILYKNSDGTLISKHDSKDDRVWKIIDYGGLDYLDKNVPSEHKISRLWGSLYFFFETIKKDKTELPDKIFGDFAYGENAAMDFSIDTYVQLLNGNYGTHQQSYREILAATTETDNREHSENQIDITYPYPPRVIP